MGQNRRFIWLLMGLIVCVKGQENTERPTTTVDSVTETGRVTIQLNTSPSTPQSTTTVVNEATTTRQPETSPSQNLPTEEPANPLVVEISTGKIEGRELTTKGLKKPYYAFQGIPYAKPPLGDLRFREPVPAEKWDTIRKTVHDGSNCIQFVSMFGSEDCLYLNVFSPKPSTNEPEAKLLPVMVWIYGGAFIGGSAQFQRFGPDYFIEEDVLIVSFNYRLGVFGFLSTEDYAAPGNWGLKDQILALKWVRENIKKFGGDPDNVTVFGQSAGSACVSILVQSPLARGLFHKAIMQSGTSLNQWAHAKHPRKSAFVIAKLLDIHTNDTRELVEQLRKVDFRTLHVVSVSTDLGETIFHNPLDGLVFAPTTEVNHPGAVITNHSHTILKNGDFNRIPVIVGFNSQEALGVFNVLSYLKPYVVSYDLFSTRLVPGSLNIDRYLRKVVVAQLIRLKYFGWRPIVFSNNQLVQFVTDDQFARPIYEYIKQSSKYAPTYFYIFSYQGPLGINGKRRDNPGVSHLEETSYFWNKDSNISNAPQEDILTRKRLLRLWSNFAKTGNPTPTPDELLQKVTWPPTNIKTMVYLNITENLELDTDIERYSIGFWEEIFEQHGNPPYDTY